MCTYCITPLAKGLCDTPLCLLTLKFHDLHPFLPTPSVYTHPIFNCVFIIFVVGSYLIKKRERECGRLSDASIVLVCLEWSISMNTQYPVLTKTCLLIM